jgi:hypothetical protein
LVIFLVRTHLSGLINGANLTESGRNGLHVKKNLPGGLDVQYKFLVAWMSNTSFLMGCMYVKGSGFCWSTLYRFTIHRNPRRDLHRRWILYFQLSFFLSCGEFEYIALEDRSIFYLCTNISNTVVSFLLRACTSDPTIQLCHHPRVPFRRSTPKTDAPPPTHRDAASQCRHFAAPPRRLQVDVARPSTPTLRSTRHLPFTQPSPPPLP